MIGGRCGLRKKKDENINLTLFIIADHYTSPPSE